RRTGPLTCGQPARPYEKRSGRLVDSASGTVRLRPYAAADLALTAALESDPAVMRHLGGVGTGGRIGDVHERRLAGAARGDWYRVIVPDGGSAPVGLVAVWASVWAGDPVWELGVMLLPGHQHRGIAADAVLALFAEIRAARPLPPVHAFTGTGNRAAARIARRLGFTALGEVDLDYEGRPLR